MAEPIRITLNHEETLRAESLARKVSSTKTVRNPRSYTGLPGNFEKYLVCYRGELAFRSWLKQKGIRGLYRYCTKGRSTVDEFIIYRHGVVHNLDVKTASKDYMRYLMVPLKQFMRYTDTQFYVGARDCMSHVELWGVVDRSKLRMINPEPGFNDVPTLKVLLGDLAPLDPWVDIFDLGDVTERKL